MVGDAVIAHDDGCVAEELAGGFVKYTGVFSQLMQGGNETVFFKPNWKQTARHTPGLAVDLMDQFGDFLRVVGFGSGLFVEFVSEDVGEYGDACELLAHAIVQIVADAMLLA